MDKDENNNEELAGAVDDMRDSVTAFTYDGDRSTHDHVSGAPEERNAPHAASFLVSPRKMCAAGQLPM